MSRPSFWKSAVCDIVYPLPFLVCFCSQNVISSSRVETHSPASRRLSKHSISILLLFSYRLHSGYYNHLTKSLNFCNCLLTYELIYIPTACWSFQYFIQIINTKLRGKQFLLALWQTCFSTTMKSGTAFFQLLPQSLSLDYLSYSLACLSTLSSRVPSPIAWLECMVLVLNYRLYASQKFYVSEEIRICFTPDLFSWKRPKMQHLISLCSIYIWDFENEPKD